MIFLILLVELRAKRLQIIIIIVNYNVDDIFKYVKIILLKQTKINLIGHHYNLFIIYKTSCIIFELFIPVIYFMCCTYFLYIYNIVD